MADGSEVDSVTERSLQVTYRKGRAFAAYLRLSHESGRKSAHTVASFDGLLIVDYGTDGRAFGIEITSPQAVSRERLNALLAELGEVSLADHEYEPLRGLEL
jgi:hypothetical protein